jgi:hypothetical protein
MVSSPKETVREWRQVLARGDDSAMVSGSRELKIVTGQAKMYVCHLLSFRDLSGFREERVVNRDIDLELFPVDRRLAVR